MRWESKHIKTETLRVGVKKQIVFTPLEELPEIAYLSSSCGCSVPKLVDNKIIVTYTPGSIPDHLVKFGEYINTGKITVTYKDNTQDILRFTALIKKKQRKLW